MDQKSQECASSILHGIVLPSKWSKDGRVLRISLNTHDENEYLIDYNGRGKELFNYLRQMIEIEGKVIRRIGGDYCIKVSRYSLIYNQ